MKLIVNKPLINWKVHEDWFNISSSIAWVNAQRNSILQLQNIFPITLEHYFEPRLYLFLGLIKYKQLFDLVKWLSTLFYVVYSEIFNKNQFQIEFPQWRSVLLQQSFNGNTFANSYALIYLFIITRDRKHNLRFIKIRWKLVIIPNFCLVQL